MFRLTTRDRLTELPVPFELEFGRTYFWCAYTDANSRVAPRKRAPLRRRPSPTALVLNEIMAASDSAVANDGHYPD